MEPWVVAELKAQARARGQSLEDSLRQHLQALALQPRLEMAERARRLRQDIARECGVLPDSADAIREDRDARG